MKWSKQKIELIDIPQTINKLMLAIKNGDNKIEQMRCVYIEDTDIPTILMPYDFIDLQPPPKIKEFYLYQVLDS